MTSLLRTSALLTGATLGLLSQPAQAQGVSDAAVRRRMVIHAQELARAGQHAEALDLATRAASVMPSPSLHALIATEHLAVSHYAEAIEAAELCKLGAARDATLRNRAVIVRTCETVEETAKTHVGSLIVRVTAPAPAGLTVTVAGRALNSAFYGVEYIVDPGTVEVEASAPHFITLKQSVSMAEHGTATVEVHLEPEPVTTNPGTGTTGTTTTTNVNAGAGSTTSANPNLISIVPQPPPPPPARSIAGPVIFMSVGGGALIGSLALFLARNGAFAALEKQCALQGEGLVCVSSAENLNQYNTVLTLNGASIGLLVAGGIAIAGGITWLAATSGKSETPRNNVRVTGFADGQSVWIGVGGTL